VDGDDANDHRFGLFSANCRRSRLCFILALYAFAVFGYITATLATFLCESDAEERGAEKPTLAELQTEIKE
jgi:hypothetical protein